MKKRCYLLFLTLLVTYSLLSAKSTDQGRLSKELYSLYSLEEYETILNQIWNMPKPLSDSVIILAAKSHKMLFHIDSAQYYFEESLLLSINYSQITTSLLDLSELLLHKGEVKKSLQYVERAKLLPRGRKSTDQNLTIEFYLCHLVDYDNPKPKIQRYEELINEISLEAELLTSMYVIFLNELFSLGEVELAGKYLNKYNDVIELIDHTGAQYAQSLIVNAYYNYVIGEYDEALNLLDNKLYPEIRNKDSDWARYSLMEYYRFVPYVYSVSRDYKRAIDAYQKFIELAKYFLGPENGKVAFVYNGISSLYKFLGDENSARRYGDLAAAIFKKSEDESELIWGYEQEADQYYAENEIDSALNSYLYIIGFNSNTQIIEKSKARSYYSLAEIYFHKNEFSTAKFMIEKCIEIQLKVKHSKRNILRSQILQIEILRAMGLYTNANDIYSTLFSQANFGYRSDNSIFIDFLNSYTNQLISEGRYDSAQACLDKYLNLPLDISRIEGALRLKSRYVQTFYNKSSIYLGKHSLGEEKGLDDSYNQLLKSANLIALNRKSYRPDVERIAQFETEKKVFERGIQLAHLLYKDTGEQLYLDDLFSFIEFGKSNQLLESLNRNLAIQKTQIPDSLLLNISSLRQRATYLESVITKLEKKQVLPFEDSTNLVRYKTQLASNRYHFNEAILQLEQDFPAYYDINYNQQLASIPSIQGKLKENEALLQYAFAEEDLYLVLVTKNSAEVRKLENVSLDMVNGFQKILQPEFFTADEQEGYGQFTSQSAALYQKLLEPALSDMGSKITKLHIIPDRHLNFLPFELFIKTDEGELTELDYASLDYAGLDFDISYGYSVSVLEKQLDRQGQKRSFEGNLLAVAPSYGDFLENEGQLAALGKFRDDFTELSFNKEEVNQISDFFETTALKGKAASEKAFVEKIGSYDIVHLAMHAFVDNEEPDKSKLVFSDVEGEETDNFLHNFEIYNLSLNTRMAVLSACNTGYGDLKTGEGVMSVARAFTYAGAESVVTSHWRVDDRASSILMKYFYQHLSQGMAKDAALRQAKLQYLQQASPNTSHPFYWNNFVILGDPAPLVIKTPVYWYWLGAVALLLSIVAFFYVRRSRV